VTSAPKCAASWTAKVPTPPDAPFTSTFMPCRTFTVSRMAHSAVTPDMTEAAASSNPTPAGIGASRSAGTTVNSANAPAVTNVLVHSDPNTRSPTPKSTPVPTASTIPATSLPRTTFIVRRRRPCSRST
jgi:hypothetical protein